MKRIDTPTALPGGHFSNSNPNAAGQPTQLDASWFEAVQEEICTVVESEGIPLAPSNNGQLLAAINSIISSAIESIPGFAGSGVPAGTTIKYRGGTVPSGYVPEDGRLLYIADCPGLYAAIGTSYNNGAVPVGTFRVPDSRGRFELAAGAGSGLTARALGAKGGFESVTLTLAQMPAHDHANDIYNRLFRAPYAGSLTGNDTNGSGSEQAVGAPDSQPMLSKGGGQSHENMPPFIVAQSLIRLGPTDTPNTVV